MGAYAIDRRVIAIGTTLVRAPGHAGVRETGRKSGGSSPMPP